MQRLTERQTRKRDWTDDLTAQEFMDRSRAEGHTTIGTAMDAYVVEIPGPDRAWAGLNAEELEEIRDVLMSYLFLTRGVEWREGLLVADDHESPAAFDISFVRVPVVP